MGTPALLVLLVTICGTAGDLIKTGSAYDGLVVAIHDSVPEGNAYLEALMTLIEKASVLLYNATSERAYFRHVTISIPKSWNASTNAAPVYVPLYSSAHLRVDSPWSPDLVELPFTLQPGECGEPGQYIQMTTPLLMDENGGASERYGPIERLLVHEWSHLRYGVFDEYGIPGHKHFPLFYFKDGFLEVSTCPFGVRGWLRTSKGEEICDVFQDQVVKDCEFIPDLEDAQFDSSLMGIPSIPSVNQYCTDDDVPKRKHNTFAPTKQNVFCQRRSTADVIFSHPDFTKMGIKTKYEKPTFKVVRQEPAPQRFVLIMDLSVSMQGAPMRNMIQASQYLVQQMLPEGSQIGIVTFHSWANTVFDLVIVNTTTRQKASDAIKKLRVGSATSIGSGLQEGLKVLNKAKVPTPGTKFILMTDGAENTPPSIPDVLQALILAGVEVHAIAFGRSASLLLEDLATKTKGKSYLYADFGGESTGDLNQIFLESISVADDDVTARVELQSEEKSLISNKTQFTAFIDKELGKNTLFVVTTKFIGRLDFSLSGPNGEQFNSTSDEFKIDKKDSYFAMFNLTLAASGAWTLAIKRTTFEKLNVDFSVISEPRTPGSEPVRIKSWINGTNFNYPDVPKLYVHVTKGSDVIIRAKVQAIVTMDINMNTSVPLRDDGSGADVLADDGIYSAYFTQFQATAKRYTVKAEVKGSEETLQKRTASPNTLLFSAPPVRRNATKKPSDRPPSSSFNMDQFVRVSEDPEAGLQPGVPVGDFDRTTTGGTFQVIGFNTLSDKIKPSPVRDLKVMVTGQSDIEGDLRKHVTLQWVAPGDDMYTGKAASYDMRVFNISDEQLFDFYNGIKLDSTNATVVNGTLEPLEGGTLQDVTILLPLELDTKETRTIDVFFSIRATDKAKNVGDVGNFAAAHFGYVIKAEKEIAENKVTEKVKGGLATGVIVGIAIACVAAVGIFIAATVFCFMKKRRSVV